MSDMIQPRSWSEHADRRIVGVFAHESVAKASADLVREQEPAMHVRTMERRIKAGGCVVTVYVVVVTGRKRG